MLLIVKLPKKKKYNHIVVVKWIPTTILDCNNYSDLQLETLLLEINLDKLIMNSDLNKDIISKLF